MDGAFGREQCPADLHTIADLSNLPAILRARSGTEDDIQAIAHGNFLQLNHAAWRWQLRP